VKTHVLKAWLENPFTSSQHAVIFYTVAVSMATAIIF